jgi:1,4-alpha-glucan branching enzyme
MKVIIDWVPNHTGADHRWLTEHPDFFSKDSAGKFIAPFDWTDVRKLNYSNMVLRDSMIGAMKFWINKTDIDGFRCDVAGEVPNDFWKSCIKILRKQKDIFMLAEGDKPSLLHAGFDASYPWNMFNMMKNIAKGDRPAFAIDSIRNIDDAQLPAKGLRMYFTSNHDENSWNKADFETMPGESHAPFAVLTQTMVRGVPLIYSGQEEPVLKALEFFEKDPINFGKFQREKFYKTLLQLRKTNAALAADASFKKVSVGDENSVYSFVREKNGKKVFVILNLTPREQSIEVHEPGLLGKTYNVFMGNNEVMNNKQWKMQPWGYVIYEYR